MIAVRAFAKINLSMHVGPAREDGFHDVRTILQSIDLADRVVCDRRRGPFELCILPPIGLNIISDEGSRPTRMQDVLDL